MPYLHCNDCHYEWEGQEESRCSWCGGDSYILERLTSLETTNTRKISSYISRNRFDKIFENIPQLGIRDDDIHIQLHCLIDMGRRFGLYKACEFIADQMNKKRIK